MAGWQKITLENRSFLLKEDGGVSFLHSMKDTDFRSNEAVAWLKKVLGLSRIVKPRQVHGAKILMVEESEKDLEGDGLILSRRYPATGVGVLTADCVPVLMVAPQHLIILHVGWRGLADGIVQEGARKLKGFYDCIDGIEIWFGPHIKQCCYKVGEEFLENLKKNLPPDWVNGSTIKREGRIYFSLEGCIKMILLKEGFEWKRFESCDYCTRCSGIFPSYRRDGERATRMINLAWRQQWSLPKE